MKKDLEIYYKLNPSIVKQVSVVAKIKILSKIGV